MWMMSRWKPDARGRIARAALELYGKRGFEHTTVAEIAKRAGVTERTFFRHFADKREVLFGGSHLLQDLMVATVANAPVSVEPIDAVAASLQASTTYLDDREYSRKRQKILNANAELRERELIKLATLASAIAEALRRRGVKEPAASLTAEAGIAVFKVAFERWLSETNQRHLSELVRESLDQLKTLMADDRRSSSAKAQAGPRVAASARRTKGNFR
jgi:AcrR family transcriptional regulator